VSLNGAAIVRLPATRIAVTSGKGGVGKTSLTVNLAVALARFGHRVGVVDADFALGNVDVLMGLSPEHHVGEVLAGRMTVDEITIAGPSGVRVIPAGSGVRSLTSLGTEPWRRLVDAIDAAALDLDFLFFDTATGLGDAVFDVISLADYALVVTSNDPAAVVDAYAVIKLINASQPAKPLGLVVNSARDAEEAGLVFRQIALAAERFLGRTIRNEGHVLEDRAVRDAGLAQSPVMGTETSGPAERGIRRLASRLALVRPSGAGPWPARPATAPATSLSLEASRCA